MLKKLLNKFRKKKVLINSVPFSSNLDARKQNATQSCMEYDKLKHITRAVLESYPQLEVALTKEVRNRNVYELQYTKKVGAKSIAKAMQKSLQVDLVIHKKLDAVVELIDNQIINIIISRSTSTCFLQNLYDATKVITPNSITLILGNDPNGEVVTLELNAFNPHILIGGTTGSGKSVFMKSVIYSLLASYSVDHVQVVVLDTKKVDYEAFSIFTFHYIQVVTSCESCINVLENTLQEVRQRYELFKQHKVKNIQEYNAQVEKPLKYLILFCDEFADLVTYDKPKVTKLIQSITQISRASGIHLIIATQNPTAAIVSNIIKACFPARICLRVASKLNSRAILGVDDGVDLKGQGDALLQTEKGLQRFQSTYVHDEYIKILKSYYYDIDKIN